MRAISVRSSRLAIRAFELEDLDLVYFSWFQDSQTLEFLTIKQDEVSEKSLKDSWHEMETAQSGVLYGIWNQAGKKIGSSRITNIDPVSREAAIGYLIGNPIDRRLGFASEALCALSAAVLSKTPLRRLYAGVHLANGASVSVLKKAGFKPMETLSTTKVPTHRESAWFEKF